MNRIKEMLKDGKVLVGDGAWGTMLQAKGLKPGECPELWNITHPDAVFEIAKSYIDAGADIIETNSFGGNPIRLSGYGLDNRVYELNEAAASISKQAAKDKIVLGSIGPTGVFLMMGEHTPDDFYKGFSEQARALEAGGADVICIETMCSTDEACIAIQAALENTDLEIACTFTFQRMPDKSYRTMMGHSPSDAIIAVREAGAHIIGANCGNGVEEMVDLVKEMRSIEPDLPIIVQANAGLPVEVDGVYQYVDTPALMASKVPALLDAGANIIGGCCGTTPEHIIAMAQVVRGYE